MRWSMSVRAVAVLLSCYVMWSASGGMPAQNADTKPKSGLTVYDTGKPSAEALAFGNNDWTAIPQDKTADAFKGDAVISNGRVTAVLRKQDSALEVYGVKTDGAVSRFRLRLLTAQGEPAAKLERASLTENSKAGVTLEATFKTAKGSVAAGKFRLKRGEVAIQTEPGAGAAKLRVECPGRYVVLPDFFADDITLDAAKLPLASLELPSENFVMHLTGKGDAIAMCVFENRQQDVKVTLSGDGDKRIVTGSEIGFEGKKVWVALMEAPGIWHTKDVRAADAGKTVPLDWKMPFPAAWRVDFSRTDGLTDSWEMLLQDKKEGDYRKPSWLGSGDERIESNRKRWNTVLGSYPYPCWSDQDGQGFLQPLKKKGVLEIQGTALVYPINRVMQTPLDAYAVVDIMRNTLGVGPCEHILDIEGQKSEYKGRATCSVRDTLTPIYTSKQQKEQRAKVDKTLDEGLAFVKHIRGRIERYVEFGHKMRAYLAEQKKAHPESSKFIDEIDGICREIDARLAARRDEIKTPEYVAQMNADFRKNVLDDTGPDALKNCKAYAKALVEIGGSQDELAGECRWVVKSMRQVAGIRMAMDPRVAPIAMEIRARTQEALRNPAGHEGARH
jgi:hypothetical protein